LAEKRKRQRGRSSATLPASIDERGASRVPARSAFGNGQSVFFPPPQPARAAAASDTASAARDRAVS
jgi:hypothetical protein